MKAGHVTLDYDKMGRTTDGQEFRETLYDAENNSLNKRHCDNPALMEDSLESVL